MSEEMKFGKEDALGGVPEELQSVPVGPMIGISAIALNMALKYHDINTVQDGQLYQQYKLEGRNMRDLHLDVVFHTACQIEAHLISANERVAKLLVIAALSENPADETAEDDRDPQEKAAE